MNEKVSLSSIRVSVPGLDADEQVWIQSSISATHKLPRNHKDDFSFTDTDIVMISNRGESVALMHLEAIRCAEGGLFIGSNRRGGIGMRPGEILKMKMRPGEVLTVRSVCAREPGQTHADGSAVRIRAGQSVVMA